jgi:diketogulonate reductase-like aldo/keto reductase
MQHVAANGAEIPAIGFGTWRLSGRECATAVAEAIRVGYRHIDTAANYGNEEAVGEGIRASGVDRDEIFVTTKIPQDSLADGPCQRSAEASLKRLGLDEVDLILIHWPSPRLSAAAMMAPLNEVKRRGLARHIGVSNFTTRLVAESWKATEEPLVANQCEYHPYLNQDRVIAACREHGMAFIAYCPLGRQRALNEPAISAIAKAKGCTPAQVVLRWETQQGLAVIPKSAHAARIAENFALLDFSLSDDEMAAVSGLTRSHRERICDFGFSPQWDD